MPRLIFLFLVALLAGWAVWAMMFGQMQRPGSGQTYRPRRCGWMNAPWGGKIPPAGEGLVHLVRREELDGMRDGLSSEPIDPSRELYRCGACLAFYHRESVAALKQDNNGRCAACGSGDLAPARVIGD
jgi:hypothetical protein